MWIFLNDAFLSVVEHFDDKNSLVVRARFPGDITSVFPKAKVSESPNNDYAYRTVLSKQEVADVMAQRVLDINYTNFKGSVMNKKRHDLYFDVWETMYLAQKRKKIARK